MAAVEPVDELKECLRASVEMLLDKLNDRLHEDMDYMREEGQRLLSYSRNSVEIEAQEASFERRTSPNQIECAYD